ncbi:hypothetical protein B0H13DRAFT_53880 [Mycena leptocephala]|nr:hypothetical protein B0H13DRAFT_53880 [Mycena leptocephala]
MRARRALTPAEHRARLLRASCFVYHSPCCVASRRWFATVPLPHSHSLILRRPSPAVRDGDGEWQVRRRSAQRPRTRLACACIHPSLSLQRVGSKASTSRFSAMYSSSVISDLRPIDCFMHSVSVSRAVPFMLCYVLSFIIFPYLIPLCYPFVFLSPLCLCFSARRDAVLTTFFFFFGYTASQRESSLPSLCRLSPSSFFVVLVEFFRRVVEFFGVVFFCYFGRLFRFLVGRLWLWLWIGSLEVQSRASASGPSFTSLLFWGLGLGGKRRTPPRGGIHLPTSPLRSVSRPPGPPNLHLRLWSLRWGDVPQLRPPPGDVDVLGCGLSRRRYGSRVPNGGGCGLDAYAGAGVWCVWWIGEIARRSGVDLGVYAPGSRGFGGC